MRGARLRDPAAPRSERPRARGQDGTGSRSQARRRLIRSGTSDRRWSGDACGQQEQASPMAPGWGALAGRPRVARPPQTLGAAALGTPGTRPRRAHQRAPAAPALSGIRAPSRTRGASRRCSACDLSEREARRPRGAAPRALERACYQNFGSGTLPTTGWPATDSAIAATPIADARSLARMPSPLAQVEMVQDAPGVASRELRPPSRLTPAGSCRRGYARARLRARGELRAAGSDGLRTAASRAELAAAHDHARHQKNASTTRQPTPMPSAPLAI